MAEKNNSRRNRFNSVTVDEVHTNVGQEVIEITSDRLRLILNENIGLMSSKKDWQTPLSIIITILLVLLTAEFKPFFGFSGDTWSAVFIISLFLSLIWFFASLMKLKKIVSVDYILNRMKNKP